VKHRGIEHHADRHLVGIVFAERDLHAVTVVFADSFAGFNQALDVVFDDVAGGRIADGLDEADARMIREEDSDPLVFGVKPSESRTHWSETPLSFSLRGVMFQRKSQRPHTQHHDVEDANQERN